MEDQILDADFREENYREVKYVGFWARVVASLVDMVVMIPLFVLIVLNLIYLKSLAADILIALLLVSYKPYMEYKYGATFGKMALKIKVVDEQFGNIDLQTSFIRNFLWIAPGLVSIYHSYLIFTHPNFISVDSFWTYAEFVEAVPDPTGQFLSWMTILAVIFVAFTRKKQGLHDLMAKTFCISAEE